MGSSIVVAVDNQHFNDEDISFWHFSIVFIDPSPGTSEFGFFDSDHQSGHWSTMYDAGGLCS